ncbi:hypothetical protein [Pseudonocardia sp. TRM90224]|uniref:hypothetical protein n=1 Tax=Pseudonocardia sp. TRM90224 TaxID=2812678 RepID=UPI001E621821|nr:hypothetical protein [Pseudonocardia sp. TRM90224]
MGAQRAVAWRRTTIAGLVAGAVGIGLLWASGMVAFPFYPPPGMLILAAGALFVALAPWRWAPAVGAALGLFVIVGFLLSSGTANLLGALGPVVSLGSAVQVIGVVAAAIGGVMATVSAYRSHHLDV